MLSRKLLTPLLAGIALGTPLLGQSVFAEDFEFFGPGSFPSSWSTDFPNDAQVVSTSVFGFGARALEFSVNSGAGLSFDTVARTPDWSPTKGGRIGFDMLLTSANWGVLVTVVDGVGAPNSVIRFGRDGVIAARASIGSGLWGFFDTEGTWTPGVPTRIEIDLRGGTILQDGSKIGDTSDNATGTVNGIGAVGVRVALTSNSSGPSSLLLDNLAMDACMPPSNYCMAGPNSVSSFGANLFFAGSNFLATDEVAFAIFNLPPSVPVLLVHGPEPAQQPFGNGFLCIAPGGLSLFRGPVIFSGGGPLASLNYDLDLGSTVYGSGPGALIPGSAWYFQGIYRDLAAAGAGFNASDAVRVEFCN